MGGAASSKLESMLVVRHRRGTPVPGVILLGVSLRMTHSTVSSVRHTIGNKKEGVVHHPEPPMEPSFRLVHWPLFLRACRGIDRGNVDGCAGEIVAHFFFGTVWIRPW